MKRLHFVISNNLSVLHDELLQAIPTLVPDVSSDGNRYAIIQVEGDADNVWFTVPDNTDEVDIQTVIDAHDATPVVSRLDVLTTKLTDDSITFTEMKELMRLKG